MAELNVDGAGNVGTTKATSAGTLADPYLRGIYNSSGTLITGTSNDDNGQNRNAQLSFTATTTGTHYIAAGAYGNQIGSYKVSVNDVTPTTTEESNFDISFYMANGHEYRTYFEAAADFWQEVVLSELEDVYIGTVSGINIGTIDDLMIYCAVIENGGRSGPVASAGYLRRRSTGNELPYLGVVYLNEAHIQEQISRGQLTDVIKHEIGHVLGISSGGFRDFELTNNSNYVGANGLREYNNYTGYQASSVPLEASGGGGTAGSHWSRSIFQNELMEGWVASSMPLSRLTIAALEDIGYDVNYNADCYKK